MDAMDSACPICRQSDVQDLCELPCGHEICEFCIAAVQESARDASKSKLSQRGMTDQPRCPFCRTCFNTWTTRGVSIELNVDHHGGDLCSSRSSRSSSSSCSNIDSKPSPQQFACDIEGCQEIASRRCHSGCGYMCENCFLIHGKFPASRNHVVSMSLCEPDSKILMRSGAVCRVHPNSPVKFYCNQCSSDPFMCTECALKDRANHPSHTHASSSDAIVKIHAEIQNHAEKLRSKLRVVQETRDSIMQDNARIEDCVDRVKLQIQEKINVHRQRLKEFEQLLDRFEDKACQEVDEMRAIVVKYLESNLDDVSAAENYIQYANDLFQSIVTSNETKIAPQKLYEASKVISKACELNTDIPTSCGLEFVFKPEAEINLQMNIPDQASWVQPSSSMNVFCRPLSSLQSSIKSRVGTLTGTRSNSSVSTFWGLAINQNTSRVYTVDRANSNISVMDLNLDLIKLIEGNVPGHNILTGPTGLAISKSGLLAVVDTAGHRVQILYEDGGLVQTLGKGIKGKAIGYFDSPYNAAFDSSDNLYITDCGNARIVKVSPDWRCMTAFEMDEDYQGMSVLPEGICINRNDEIFVLGRGSDTIQVYNPSFKSIGSIKVRKVSHNSLCIGPYSSIVLSDYASNAIYMYDMAGCIIHEIKSSRRSKTTLNNPMGVAFGPNNRLYVSEFTSHRVQCF
eukprot:TRINITY_DN11498_c0_g1_i1.p1 TRINITY_DN11498_c0_g1~~TRINITY_DN11498_c0_g1_i1.p1  ORF type:complete len:682 (+),score=118.70 TRINITY_DN11498_c0_g1_i1:46-2091(+)